MRTAALILAASPAFADPAAQWGASSAILHPCDAADACVTVANQLSAAPSIVAVILERDGLAVEIVIIMGIGAMPDRAVITPPVGWISDPPWADIEEADSMTFRLFAPLMG